MSDEAGSYLSKIASGFNKALGGEAPEEEGCPHCGKKPSDAPSPDPSPSEDPSKSIGQRIGFPGS